MIAWKADIVSEKLLGQILFSLRPQLTSFLFGKVCILVPESLPESLEDLVVLVSVAVAGCGDCHDVVGSSAWGGDCRTSR